MTPSLYGQNLQHLISKQKADVVHCAAAAVLFSFSLLSCSRYREICFSTFPTPNFLQSLHQLLNYLIKSTLLGGISTQTWEHDILKRPYPALVTPPHQISTLMNKSLTLCGVGSVKKSKNAGNLIG